MASSEFKHSLKVILSVCMVCSLLVSSAAILLKARQNENQRQNRIRNILTAAELYREHADPKRIYERRIKPLLIDLQSGREMEPGDIGPGFDIEAFDIASFAADPELGEAIAAEVDAAKIKRRPRFMVIYIAKTPEGRVGSLILPIYGKGLWSTLYGFLALERNLQTISGITFYQHGETPGLGGEIENPGWQRQWQGKQGYDEQGRVILKVVRGEADAASPNAGHQIDGLAGATLTSRGVQNMLHYWLGDHGYGPLIKRLRRQWREQPPQLAR
ncbi:MAG: Na(+)-translocating NADH-quinone reductase subunit C [Gammaproteobacteria bacterium]